MYFSTNLISEKRKFSYTKCCWWDLWSDILKEGFQCVYREANGVKSRGLPASRTLCEHKCKTNRMKTSLTQSEHMKARRRWSWVRGAEQTLGDSLWSVNETHMSPTSYDSRFPREPRFSCFTPQSPSASDTGAHIAASPPKQRRFQKCLRRSHSRLVSWLHANTTASVSGIVMDHCVSRRAGV